MTTTPTTARQHGTGDGLWRWLAGGVVAGCIVLGLLVAAFAIGYHRGEDHAASSTAPAPAAPAVPAAPASPAAPAAPAPSIGAVAVTPALVAKGKALYAADGCSACHSLTGAAGVGPSFKGLAGSSVALATGQSVTADDAYLEQSILDPDADIVKGFHPGLMGPAIAGHDLAAHTADVRALVAFIKSQK